MEVEIRLEVCNYLPAEWTSPENGWRSNAPLTLRRQGKR